MPSITIIQIAASRFVYPQGHPEGPGPGELFCYVVHTPEGPFLVDTGIGTGHAWIDEHYRPSSFDLIASLRQIGVEPGSLAALICSHLHFDHCGNNRLFPGVPIYVQRAEYEAALGKGYTIADWFMFSGADYRLLDGGQRLNHWVEVVPTPGHTPGHQSVLVKCPGGLEVIVAQAAYSAAEFGAYARVPEPEVREDCWSKGAYARSLKALHQMRPARAYFSHDPTVWSGVQLQAER
jgi:N-acyl homoserine lactone hydrolase